MLHDAHHVSRMRGMLHSKSLAPLEIAQARKWPPHWLTEHNGNL